MHRGPRLFAFLLVLLCSLAGPGRTSPLPTVHSPADSSVIIGVLAKRGPQQCLAKWGPTARYLGRRIPGHDFEILPLGFAEIQQAVDRGQVDFILANSSYYVELEVGHGVQRILTLENLHAGGTSHRVFAGVIFCRADRTDVRGLQDLRGRSLAAVDEESFGGWRMQWRELLHHGIDPYADLSSLEFAGSHDEVVYAVLAGQVAVGAVRSDTLERMAQEGLIDLAELRVINPHPDCSAVHMPFLHSTQHYPEWPLARTRNTPIDLAKQVTSALLQMEPDDEAARAARCTGWSPPENYQAVHECLLELRCPPYENFGKVSFFAALRKVWPWLAVMMVLSLTVLLVIIRDSRLKGRLAKSQKLAAERDRAWDFVRRVLDNLPVGLLLIDADQRTVVEANPTALRMMGRQGGEVLGRSCHHFICPHRDGECPILDAGQPVDNSERILLAADNRRVPVLKTVVPMTVQGRRYLLEAMLDISERKEAEAERGRLTHAMEQVGEMIVITDQHGSILYVNPAFTRITGYSREEVLGRELSLLRSDEQEPGFYGRLWESLGRGETWTGRIVNRRKDGSLFTESTTISPVRDAQGDIVHFVGVMRDISEQIALENRYQHAQKMETIGRLAGGVAHDYNNMIGVILGYTDLILDTKGLESNLREAVLQVQGAAQRSADLTRQLLGFARKQPIDPRVQNLNETVAKLLQMLKRLIGEDIELEWSPGANPYPVKLDPSQVDQVLVNLCVNARDAMLDGGHITIETANVSPDQMERRPETGSPEQHYLRLSVIDNGCGMPPEVLDKAFEPFYTTKVQGKGTGLGLATVYGIVQQNEGLVDITSEVGRGTQVSIFLPRHLGETADRVTMVTPERGQRSATILLVEDEASLLKVVTRVLEGRGYEVLAAGGPAVALELARTYGERLNLLITDVVMPEMNGAQLAREIRLLLPDLPCLFMSGYLPDELQHLGDSGLGNHFIQKPFQFPRLEATVQEVLNESLRV